jgi:hypothetical protein
VINNSLTRRGLGGSTPARATALRRARAGCDDFLAQPIRGTLTFTVRNPGGCHSPSRGAAMFEVTKYQPPLIFTAIAYLALRTQTRAGDFANERAPHR